MRRLVLFGIGVYYQRFKKICSEQDVIVGVIDNNAKRWGEKLDGVVVVNPEDIVLLDYDCIILLCEKPYEMRNQLLLLGVQEEKMLSLEEYRAEVRGHEIVEFGEKRKVGVKSDILFVCNYLNYDGASMAAVHAAVALKKKGYNVTLSAQDANEGFVKEMVKSGLHICLCKGFPYITDTLKKWIEQYDIVFVNVFLMLVSACQISLFKPTVWWIHECSHKCGSHFEITKGKYPFYDDIEKMRNIYVVGVSSIAKRNFNFFYPNVIKDVLPYGIPDEWNGECSSKSEGKIVCSVIANMSNVKAQKLFLEAYGKLEQKYQQMLEIWFIGQDTSRYGEEVKEMTEGMQSVKMMGVKTREEILRLYKEIDVVVCCSLEETMSISITEGMMHGKVCLCTDAAGMADYIEDGVNGFVFQSGDADDMARQIKRILGLGKETKEICKRARETFETHFSMDVFGDNLERVLQKVKGN